MTHIQEPAGPAEEPRTDVRDPYLHSLVVDGRRTFTIVVDGIELDDSQNDAIQRALQEAVGSAMAEYAFSVTPLTERAVGGGDLVGLQFTANDGLISQLLPE